MSVSHLRASQHVRHSPTVCSMSRTPPDGETAIRPGQKYFEGGLGVYTLLLNIGILFFAVDTFLINTLMPSIVADIGGVAFYSWAMMLYLVGSIMGAASYGPLRARIGGRRSFAVGGAVFSLGALGCSIAPAIGELLVARLFQGVGGGLILAGSMAFISILFEPQLRKYAVAATNVTWIIAAIVGPVQAGIFANFGWWRGAFCALCANWSGVPRRYVVEDPEKRRPGDGGLARVAISDLACRTARAWRAMRGQLGPGRVRRRCARH